MFHKAWLDPKAREQVKSKIASIESKSGAEVVVTVATSSGYYRHADMIAGSVSSLVMFLVYLFHPVTFADDIAALLVIMCFPVGALFCAFFAPLRRLLTRSRLLLDNVRTHARCRFVDQQISCTQARIGVLVYVSLFERTAEVVADVGIPMNQLGGQWRTAVHAIQQAVRADAFPKFLEALDQLGSLLQSSVPRREDDINELPDEVVAP